MGPASGPAQGPAARPVLGGFSGDWTAGDCAKGPAPGPFQTGAFDAYDMGLGQSHVWGQQPERQHHAAAAEIAD